MKEYNLAILDYTEAITYLKSADDRGDIAICYLNKSICRLKSEEILQTNLQTFRSCRKCSNIFRSFQACSGPFRPVRTRSDTDPFRPVRTCSGTFACIRLHAEAFGRFRKI